MAEAQSTQDRGVAVVAPPVFDRAGAEYKAFQKAQARWPLLAEMDRYLVWHRRTPPTRPDHPNVPQ